MGKLDSWGTLAEKIGSFVGFYKSSCSSTDEICIGWLIWLWLSLFIKGHAHLSSTEVTKEAFAPLAIHLVQL